jgi:hypothetical protein
MRVDLKKPKSFRGSEIPGDILWGWLRTSGGTPVQSAAFLKQHATMEKSPPMRSIRAMSFVEIVFLGQELVTRAMDRMKVLGMGRLCF